MARRYTLVDLVSLARKLAAPVLDAWSAEFGTKARVVVAEVKVEAPVVVREAVVVVPEVKAEVKVVARPVALPVLLAPIPLAVLPVVIQAPEVVNLAEARQEAAGEVLYRRSKRGDRYQVATNPAPGEKLFRRVPKGKQWRYLPVSEAVAA